MILKKIHLDSFRVSRKLNLSHTRSRMVGPYWTSIIYVINLDLNKKNFFFMDHSCNDMGKHVLIKPCGLRILQLDTILHYLETVVVTIIDHPLIACLNISRLKQLDLFQFTVIDDLNNLLHVRNCIYL